MWVDPDGAGSFRCCAPARRSLGSRMINWKSVVSPCFPMLAQYLFKLHCLFFPAVFWYWGALQTPWTAAIERTMETNRFNAKLKMRARKVSASWVSWVRGYSDKSWDMFRWYMPFVILCLWSQESSRAASLAQSKACLVPWPNSWKLQPVERRCCPHVIPCCSTQCTYRDAYIHSYI